MKTSKFLLTALSVVALAHVTSTFAQEQVVKIGHTGPLSGPNAFAGKDNENGVRLAVEDLNAKKLVVGGKTLKFELVSEDDQCDPKAGVNVAQKFVDEGVKFVMGPYCSGVAIPASKVYSEGNTVVSTVGSNPKVTQGGYKNIFRIVAGDDQVGSNMADYSFKVLNAKTAAVIDDRTAYGQGAAAEFMRQAKVLGLKIVGQEFTTDKATDFAAILTNVKSKQPDVIFYGGYAPQAAPMLRQMKQLGIHAKLLGADTLCSPEMGKLAPDAVNESVYCAQGGAILDARESGPAFKTKYKKRFGQDPDVYAASFYDQTMFVGEAIKRTNSLDPVKVGAEIYSGSYKGISGIYAFDEKGNFKNAPVTVYTFKNNALSLLVSN